MLQHFATLCVVSAAAGRLSVEMEAEEEVPHCT